MSIRYRRLILVSFSLLALVAFASLSLFGGLILAALIHFLMPPGPPGTNLNAGERGNYVLISVACLIGLISFSINFLFWNYRPSEKRKRIFVFLAMLVLLPIACFNLASGDSLVRASAQAFVDIILTAVGLIVFLNLRELKTESNASLVGQSLLLCGILIFAVTVPGLYAVLWCLGALGIPVPHEAGAAVSLMSAILSLGTSVIFFKQRMARQGVKVETAPLEKRE
jgi:hypothetical protein